ncbi:preprotein translocase subunit SecE [Candidatus Kaiserbacteria bacterium]|nr:preprotein translocase subunit SecE [Candidatus Kaiserbacteria bacterium]
MKRLIQYIRDTRGEFKHVSWPTTKQTTVFTVLVIAISVFIAALLGFFDFIFTNILNTFFI